MVRLTQAPRHHLADPALAAHLLGVDPGALLRGKAAGPAVPRHGSLLGALFGSLVSQSVKVYAQAAEASVSHLRPGTGATRSTSSWNAPTGGSSPWRSKWPGAPDAADVRHLLWLRQQLRDDLLDAAVVTAGARAWRRPDGIAVIPAALLGP